MCTPYMLARQKEAEKFREKYLQDLDTFGAEYLIKTDAGYAHYTVTSKGITVQELSGAYTNLDKRPPTLVTLVGFMNPDSRDLQLGLIETDTQLVQAFNGQPQLKDGQEIEVEYRIGPNSIEWPFGENPIIPEQIEPQPIISFGEEGSVTFQIFKILTLTLDSRQATWITIPQISQEQTQSDEVVMVMGPFFKTVAQDQI